jgi:hypothetical protein
MMMILFILVLTALVAVIQPSAKPERLFVIFDRARNVVADNLTFDQAKAQLEPGQTMGRMGGDFGRKFVRRTYDDIAKWCVITDSRVYGPFENEQEANEALQQLLETGELVGKAAEYAFVDRRVLDRKTGKESNLSEETQARLKAIEKVVADCDGKFHDVGSWCWVASKTNRDDEMAKLGFLPAKKYTREGCYVYLDKSPDGSGRDWRPTS